MTSTSALIVTIGGTLSIMRLMKVLGQVEVCKFSYHLIFLQSQNQLGNWVLRISWSFFFRTEPAPICLSSCITSGVKSSLQLFMK